MTIQVHIQLSGESAGEISNDLRQLLNGMTAYRGEPISTIDSTVAVAQKNEAPKLTAAQKKAAEKTAAAAIAQQAIQTGEERTDPAADKQDAADEAADTAAAKTVDLTHDDVKKLLGGYVMAYGMEAAQADGTGFIGAAKISEIPNTQAALAAAVIGIAKGINGNPNKRELNGDGLSAEKTAELKAIVAAAMAVK
jgi:hypothetical protein